MTKTDDKPQSKQTLYQIASRHSRSAISRLVELMGSTNENVALGACKALLNKTIPDLKSQELVVDIEVENKSLSDEELAIRLKKVLQEISDLNIVGL